MNYRLPLPIADLNVRSEVPLPMVCVNLLDLILSKPVGRVETSYHCIKFRRQVLSFLQKYAVALIFVFH